MEGLLISGVAADKNTARISIIGVRDEPGIAYKIFKSLAQKNISVDIILQSIGREGTKDISFTVARTDMQEAVETLDARKESWGATEVTYDDTVAKVSIVGAGMESNAGVAAKMFEALYNANINIRMIGTAEIRITVLIDEEDVKKAMLAVHTAFGLDN